MKFTNFEAIRTAGVAAWLALAVLSATPCFAVSIDWTTVGNPGNAADTTGFGAVDYSYNIDKYDVTVSQYVEFLNAKDLTGADPLGLYNSRISHATLGGVSYNAGATDGDKYGILSGDANHPINFVTFYDALRFANWLNNGQGNGSTESGAYTLTGGTPTPSNAATIVRSDDATVFLPSEDEWYKAAYLQPDNKFLLPLRNQQQCG